MFDIKDISPSYKACVVGQSPLLAKYLAAEGMDSVGYVSQKSLKKKGFLNELIDKKNILFIQGNSIDNEGLLSKVISDADKAGIPVARLVPSAGPEHVALHGIAGQENVLFYQDGRKDSVNSWKCSKIIKSLWLGWQHKGLICMSYKDIGGLLSLGRTGWSNVIMAKGEDCLYACVRKAVRELEKLSEMNDVRTKGVLLTIGVGLKDTIDDAYRAMDILYGSNIAADQGRLPFNVYVSARLREGAVVVSTVMMG